MKLSSVASLDYKLFFFWSDVEVLKLKKKGMKVILVAVFLLGFVALCSCLSDEEFWGEEFVNGLYLIKIIYFIHSSLFFLLKQ